VPTKSAPGYIGSSKVVRLSTKAAPKRVVACAPEPQPGYLPRSADRRPALRLPHRQKQAMEEEA